MGRLRLECAVNCQRHNEITVLLPVIDNTSASTYLHATKTCSLVVGRPGERRCAFSFGDDNGENIFERR